MFAALGRLVYRRRWVILVAGIIFLLASGVYGTSLFGQLKSGGFYDPAVDSSKVMDALHERLGRDPASLLVLFEAKNGETIDQPAFQNAVGATLAKVQGKPGVGTVLSYYTTGSGQLISNDKHATYAVVGLSGDEEVQANTMKVVRPLLTSDTLQVRLSGMPAISEDMNHQVSQDLEVAEMASFPILAVLLIFI